MNKLLTTIWIGDESKRPDKWLKSWQEKNPTWEYKVYGNETLYGRKWQNQSLIDFYLEREDYPGVADCMRYELLYEYGGFMHPADSLCLEPIDELFTDEFDSYAVYESETAMPGLLSPLYAAEIGSEFCKLLIDNLPETPPLNEEGEPRAPWEVTGNQYMQRMVEKYQPKKLKLFPSYIFTPIHYTGVRYEGTDKVYAVQQWGSTDDNEYVWQNNS